MTFRILKLPTISILTALALTGAPMDSWDAGKELNKELGEATTGKVQLIFELRSRLEYRPGQSFGIEPDLFADFTRVRFGWDVQAVVVDPVFGRSDGCARAYVSALRPQAPHGIRWTGTKASSNCVLTPSSASERWWGVKSLIMATHGLWDHRNGRTSRARYDGARAFWRTPRVRLEGLFISPVKLDSTRWNKPVLGEHLVGHV